MTCDEFAERIEEFITGSLSSAERAAMDEHARGCAECAALLREEEETAAAMRLIVAQVEPPPLLRSRILAAARSQRATWETMTPAGWSAETTAGRPPSAPPQVAVTRRRRWGWRLSLTHIAAAMSTLALALVLALGGWVITLRQEVSLRAAENAQLTEQLDRQRYAVWSLRESVALMNAPGRVERTLAGSENAPRARGLLYYDPAQRQAMLVANDLPQPPPDRSYQVWARNKGGVVSLGLLHFDENGAGYALVVAPTPLNQFEVIGISDEPAGGSPQPTGRNLLRGSLAQQ